MIVLRSIAFNLLFYGLFLILSVLFLPVLLLPRPCVWACVRFWARVNVWLLRWVAGIKLEIRGKENLPKGGYLVAAKHQSALETCTLITEFPDPTFILKRELHWIPIYGWYSKRAKMIPVNRGGRTAAMRDMTERAREAMREGRQIVIFPEGTRRAPGAEPAYKHGLSHLYTELNVPCVPVALNTGLFWPRRTFLRYPGTAVIEFLPPIPPGLERNAFHALMQERIEEATARLISSPF